MNYPLQLSFKKLTLAQQLSVTDANGKLMCYVKQKAFRLKEAVTVFSDAEQKNPLFTINADKVLDFSPEYHFAHANGNRFGSVKRQGMKSLWKARYDILREGSPSMTIQEANPWTKVLDSLLGEIPIIGLFTGYLFHPAYIVARQEGTQLLRLEKQPAFLEGRFKMERLADLTEDEESRALLGLIMLVLLERGRG